MSSRSTYFPQTLGVAIAVFTLTFVPSPIRAQVLFQQFYYPIDKPPKGTSWWRMATNELPQLAKLGVTAIWHPVPTKGGSGVVSMGYDPYDLYDLGSKDQKGTIATNFGTKDEYLAYIAAAHAAGLRVIADVVLNHAGGADYAEPNPIMAKLGWDDIPEDNRVERAFRPPDYDPMTMNLRSWTHFVPKGADGRPGSGRFPRDYRHFHPSVVHPDRNEPYHKPEFGNDYCYEADDRYVWNGLCDWGLWFRAQTGVDGFRLDAVKLVDPPFIADFAARTSRGQTTDGKPFYLVGEYWDTNQELLAGFQKATARKMGLFDFGLFYSLWDMTEKPQQFDMRELWGKRFADRERAVMFVSNHDVDRFQPIKRDRRIMPYAMIMTLAGQPSIFYLDYFRPEDKRLPVALESLVAVHNRFATGKEILRFIDKDVLAVEREGNLLGVFNDGGENLPRTLTVATAFGPDVKLHTVGQLPGETAMELTTDSTGQVTVTVPPGGYILLTKANADDKSNPDRFPRTPLPTTQVWEFADDLDTGTLGDTPRTVSVMVRAGKPLVVALRDTTGTGEVTLMIQDDMGKTIVKVSGKRGTILTKRTRVPHVGIYTVTVTAPGNPTTAHLAITY